MVSSRYVAGTTAYTPLTSQSCTFPRIFATPSDFARSHLFFFRSDWNVKATTAVNGNTVSTVGQFAAIVDSGEFSSLATKDLVKYRLILPISDSRNNPHRRPYFIR